MTRNIFVTTGLSKQWDTFKEPYILDLSNEEFQIFRWFIELSEPNFLCITEIPVFSEAEVEAAIMFDNIINHDTLKERISRRIGKLKDAIQKLEEMRGKLEEGA